MKLALWPHLLSELKVVFMQEVSNTRDGGSLYYPGWGRGIAGRDTPNPGGLFSRTVPKASMHF